MNVNKDVPTKLDKPTRYTEYSGEEYVIFNLESLADYLESLYDKVNEIIEYLEEQQ